MKNLSWIILLLCFIGSCQKKEADEIKPPASPIPAISFKEIKQTITRDLLGHPAESITVTINYEDGDADLGISNDDRYTNPLYKKFSSDGTPNRYYYNYFVEVFKKKNGTFSRIYQDEEFSGIFARIDANYKNNFNNISGNPFEVITQDPYRGELSYSMMSLLLENGILEASEGDTLKLFITITDRALHESNQIETAEFILGE